MNVYNVVIDTSGAFIKSSVHVRDAVATRSSHVLASNAEEAIERYKNYLQEEHDYDEKFLVLISVNMICDRVMCFERYKNE
jgi:hypothetical protein